MATYRALNNLSGVARRGELTQLSHLNPEQIGKLERAGAIARISAPPLSVLPEWDTRAIKLAKMGIETAEEFIEADLQVIAKALRVKRETAAQYQKDVKQFLIIERDEEQQ